MPRIDFSQPAIDATIREGSRKHFSRNTTLVPDHIDDCRGQVPSEAQCAAIEKQYRLVRGCTLLMNRARWFYDRVGTWGEEAGEAPCLWAWKYLSNGKTSDDQSLLNVWRVE